MNRLAYVTQILNRKVSYLTAILIQSLCYEKPMFGSLMWNKTIHIPIHTVLLIIVIQSLFHYFLQHIILHRLLKFEIFVSDTYLVAHFCLLLYTFYYTLLVCFIKSAISYYIWQHSCKFFLNFDYPW